MLRKRKNNRPSETEISKEELSAFPNPESKKKRLFWALFISTVSIIIVALILYFSISTVVRNRRNAQIAYELEQVDNYLLDGNYLDAKVRFSQLDPNHISEMNNALIFIKKAWQISNGLGHFELLEETTKVLFKKFNNNEDIGAIYLYSLLRNKKYAKAYKFSTQSISKPEYSSLVAESFLKFANEAKELEKVENLTEEDRQLIQLTKFDIQQMDALIGIYENIVKFNPDTRLVKNLVLLYCGKGNYEKAWNLSVTYLKESAPELFMQVALDARQDEEAIAILYQLIENLADETYKSASYRRYTLTLADIYLRQGNYAEAVRLYKPFVQEQSDFSVLPYRNLLAASYYLSAPEKAALKVTDSHLYTIYSPLFVEKVPFSDTYTKDVEMILSFAELLDRSNKKEEAKNFIQSYLQSNPENSHLQLLLYKLVDSSRPDFFVSQLQYLMQNDPSNELVPLTLCHYLVAFADRAPQLEETLRLCEKQFSHTQWLQFYKAYALVQTKQYKNLLEGANSFANLYSDYHLWEYAYDAAQLYNYLSKLDFAFEYAQYAETSLLSNQDLPHHQLKIEFGKVKALQGAILERKKNNVDAINAYESALQYDPGNIDALLALQKLNMEMK